MRLINNLTGHALYEYRYSMKLYVGRRQQKLIKELIEEESDEASREA